MFYVVVVFDSVPRSGSHSWATGALEIECRVEGPQCVVVHCGPEIKTVWECSVGRPKLNSIISVPFLWIEMASLMLFP